MISKETKERFLKTLEETGNVFYAAKNNGIRCTSTIYRWAQKNKKFKQKLDETVQIGRLNMVNIAEHGLTQNALKGDFKSIAFILKHLSIQYKPEPRKVFIEHNRNEETKQEIALRKKELYDEVAESYRKITELIIDLSESEKMTQKQKELLESFAPDPSLLIDDDIDTQEDPNQFGNGTV